MTPPLAELQRRLSRLIASTPPGCDEELGAREAEARALGVVGDRRLAAGERAGIYAGMWFARIHDAIAEDYPATRLALGERVFATMLRGYLAAHPPRDPSLRHAGDRLADHLERVGDAGWPAGIAEVAAFERAIVASFDAPDEAVLDADALAALAPADWPGFPVRPVASLVVLRPGHPVDTIRERLLAGETLAAMPDAPPALFSWRQGERVYHRRADALEAALLDAAREGSSLPFATLCELADRNLGDRDDARTPADDPAAAVLARLDLWLRDGLLVDTSRGE